MTIPPIQFLKIETELFKYENVSVFAFPNQLMKKFAVLYFSLIVVFFLQLYLTLLNQTLIIFSLSYWNDPHGSFLLLLLFSSLASFKYIYQDLGLIL